MKRIMKRISIPTRSVIWLTVWLLVALGCNLSAQKGDPITPPGANGVPIDSAASLFSPPTPPPPSYAPATDAANRWLLSYARLAPAVQKWYTPLAVALAGVRQQLMLELIRHDPATALSLGLFPDERVGLPAVVVAQLERIVDGRGDYRVDMGELLPAVKPSPKGGQVQVSGQTVGTVALTRSALVGQRRYVPHVYGRRRAEPSKTGLPIHGIAIGTDLALGEDPWRLLDTVELLQRGFQPGTIVAISGDHVTPLVSDISRQKLYADLLGREGLLGPHVILPWDPAPVDPPAEGCGGAAPGEPGWSVGLKRVLMIKADFDDLPGAPLDPVTGLPMTDASLASTFAQASDLFVQNSQNRTCLQATIVPDVLRLPRTAASYLAEAGAILFTTSTVREAAIVVAHDYDILHGGTGVYDPDRYDRVVVAFGPIAGQPGCASSAFGGSHAGFHGGFAAGLLLHELGHTYGFLHSSYWQPSSVGYLSPDFDSPLRDGTLYEYGDNWDPMGLGGGDSRSHFNAFFKQLAKWIDPSDWIDVTGSAVHRVYAHDRPGAIGVRALRIDADATKVYWVDVRRNFPEDVSLSSGAEVRYEVKPTSPFYTYEGLRLLDMTPHEVFSFDHALTSSSSPASFFDSVNRIRITVLGAGTDLNGPYVDVQVELHVP